MEQPELVMKFPTVLGAPLIFASFSSISISTKGVAGARVFPPLKIFFSCSLGGGRYFPVPSPLKKEAAGRDVIVYTLR